MGAAVVLAWAPVEAAVVLAWAPMRVGTPHSLVLWGRLPSCEPLVGVRPLPRHGRLHPLGALVARVPLLHAVAALRFLNGGHLVWSETLHTVSEKVRRAGEGRDKT